MKQAREEVVVDERRNIRFVNWSGLLEPGYFGSARVAERAGKVCAVGDPKHEEWGAVASAWVMG